MKKRNVMLMVQGHYFVLKWQSELRYYGFMYNYCEVKQS